MWPEQLLLRTFGLVVLCGWVILEELMPRPAPYKKEIVACNMTLNSTLLAESAILRLPPIHASRLGQPLYCLYSLVAPADHHVALHVTDLYTGNYLPHGCNGGYLKIWDGSHKPGHHRYPPNTFCGRHDNKFWNINKHSSGSLTEVEFYTKNQELATRLRTHFYLIGRDEDPEQIQHKMFLVENSSSVCFWRVLLDDCDSDCPLLSPGYPGIYPPNTECYYHVTTNNPYVAFQIKATGISASPRFFNLKHNCKDDYVDIYDSDSTTNKAYKIGRFCGEDFPNITTATNNVFLVFSSGPDAPPYDYTGFHLSVIGVTKEWHKDGYQVPNTTCSWRFNASAGSVSSPEHWLPRATTCLYSFRVTRGHYLQLILMVYGLQRNCLDYIEVTEGGRIIDKLCQRALYQESRQTFIYNLTSPFVVITYYISSGQTEGRDTRGFWMSYRQLYEPSYHRDSNRKAQPVKHYAYSKAYRISHHKLTSMWITIGLFILSVL